MKHCEDISQRSGHLMEVLWNIVGISLIIYWEYKIGMIDDDGVAIESVVDPMVYLRFKIGFSTKQQTPLSPASPAIPRGYARGYPANAPRLGKQFGPGKVCRLGHQHRPKGPDFSDVT